MRPAAKERTWQQKLAALAVVGLVVLVTATLCAAFARQFWVGDLAVHFRIQLAALCLLGAVLFAWLRRPAFAVVSVITLIVNITGAASAFEWQPRERTNDVAANAGPTVHAASINVYYRNTEYEPVQNFLREQRPDFVVLVEITPAWRQALDSLASLYPYRYFSAAPIQRGDGPLERGIMLLSVWPIEHVESIDFGAWAEPAVNATLNVRGKPLHVMGVHPCWPIGGEIAAERNRELVRIAAIAHSIKGPLVVLGDFNITPFSPHFAELLRASGLRSASARAGWQPTWPTFLPLAGIQIDHALVSPDIIVLGFGRGPRIGSDHWPIVVELLPRS